MRICFPLRALKKAVVDDLEKKVATSAQSVEKLGKQQVAAESQLSTGSKERTSVSDDSNTDVLDSLSKMTNAEFEKMLNDAAKPTLNRDEVLLKKFDQLLRSYLTYEKPEDEVHISSDTMSQFPNLIQTPRREPYSASELAVRQKHHAATSGSLGAYIKGVYRPHRVITNPPDINAVSISKLMAAGVHMGQSTEVWQPNTQPFIYGEYKGIHIIDLEKTITYLRRAAKVVEGVAESGGIVLFLGLREGQMRSVQEAARRCHGYYVTRKWVPGTITNALQDPRPRHEVNMADEETGRALDDAESTRLIKPDLIVALSAVDAKVAIGEANQARIPTIGIVDTDCDPSSVLYPIPGNDDSIRATNLICGVLGKAAESGYNRRVQAYRDYDLKKKLEATKKEE